MDQVRPLMREQRSHDCASLDWPTGPHPTPSGSGLAPTADRSKTPAAGSRSRGIDSTGPVTEGEHSKSWGADGVGLGSRLTRRGWAGAETGVAGEAGCGTATWGDDG